MSAPGRRAAVTETKQRIRVTRGDEHAPERVWEMHAACTRVITLMRNAGEKRISVKSQKFNA